MNSPLWNFAAASVRGTSHFANGMACQDSSVIQESDDGQWIAMVASDGAGTAPKSDVSSTFVTREFANALIEMASELARRAPGAWVTDTVIEKIIWLRRQLRLMAKSDDISPFHCTLVAALVGPAGGLIIHLGDGAVCGAKSGSADTKTLDLSQDYLVSLPQNGEYANETVFLTERDWVKHLRIEPLPPVDWLILGTDGGMALAMVGEKLPKTGFIKPLLESLMLSHDQTARDAAVHNSLSDKQADRLTNDDKTLCVVARSKFTHVDGAIQERLSIDAVPVPVAALSAIPLTLSGISAPQIKHAVSSAPPPSTIAKSGLTPNFTLSRRERAYICALVLVIVVGIIFTYINNFRTPTIVAGATKILDVGESVPEKLSKKVQLTGTESNPRSEGNGPSKAGGVPDEDNFPDPKVKP